MASLKLSIRTVYEAYWADIATKHKEVDGYKYGDKDVVKTHIRSDIPKRVLWATPYDATRYTDKGSDNINKIKNARVAYLKVATSQAFADVDNCFDECEAVIEQILAKVLKDKRGADVEGVWTMLVTDVNQWKSGPVTMLIGSTKYHGWELDIPFYDNTNLAYDASKWN